MDRADWSPVTYQTDVRQWSTALVLLKGGVRLHGQWNFPRSPGEQAPITAQAHPPSRDHLCRNRVWHDRGLFLCVKNFLERKPL